jgi:membrane-associated protease RseP (regulator of RpoE activity)
MSQIFTARRVLPVGLALAAVLAMGVTPSVAQDTVTNTSGTQSEATLPPPTPPQPVQASNAANRTQEFMQPTQPGAAQAIDASRNTAQSLDQQNLGQVPVPPQPPSGQNFDRPANQMAQLGVFMHPSEGPGLRISSVTPGSAAQAAGVRAGDFLLAINGQAVEIPNQATQMIRQQRPGDVVELRIWRDGVEHTLTATLQEFRPVEMQASGFENSPVYYEGNVGGFYVPGRVYGRRYYSYYPGSYGGPYSGYYGWDYPSRYYGTPNFGYYRSPWGEGVRVGGFQFGWR